MPKIPKPPTEYEYLGRRKPPQRRLGIYKKPAPKPKRPVGGRDTRPTERESMSGPRRARPMPKPDSRMKMPKELESMLSRLLPKDMPKNRLPRMPKGMLPKPMPKNRPRKAQPRRGY
tara:strand:+ start:854 stop:1204 length:351 start_codon:yes stop_codon:yes gene_type:complete